jgi:hypothetical protein
MCTQTQHASPKNMNKYYFQDTNHQLCSHLCRILPTSCRTLAFGRDKKFGVHVPLQRIKDLVWWAWNLAVPRWRVFIRSTLLRAEQMITCRRQHAQPKNSCLMGSASYLATLRLCCHVSTALRERGKVLRRDLRLSWQSDNLRRG